ncbi:MAG: Transcription elongation factor GreB [Deltaproteobacteria bacterium ADurb.Bin510]|nr:MAG: Transcription elongation factor GreB [Deltaproteobacteria bacterium ADurb.Bin510]
MRFLKRRLSELTVVGAAPADGDKVFFGAWVRLEDEQGREVCYRIVGPDEFDPKRGYISIDSPMGKALIGRTVDDEIVVSRPLGRTSFVILEVAYRPLEPA